MATLTTQTDATQRARGIDVQTIPSPRQRAPQRGSKSRVSVAQCDAFEQATDNGAYILVIMAMLPADVTNGDAELDGGESPLPAQMELQTTHCPRSRRSSARLATRSSGEPRGQLPPATPRLVRGIAILTSNAGTSIEETSLLPRPTAPIMWIAGHDTSHRNRPVREGLSHPFRRHCLSNTATTGDELRYSSESESSMNYQGGGRAW